MNLSFFGSVTPCSGKELYYFLVNVIKFILMGNEKKNDTKTGLVPALGQWQSPQQKYDALRNTWRKYEYEKFDLEAFKNEKFVSYFNREKTRTFFNEYDRYFHGHGEFDPRKEREDRQNIKEIRSRIYNEEKERIMPVVVSHEYGHRRTDLEGKPWMVHRKIETRSDMYRRYYTNLKPEKKLPVENNGRIPTL